MLCPCSQWDLRVWNHPRKQPTCNCTQHDRKYFAIYQGEFVSNLLFRFCCWGGFPKYRHCLDARTKLKPKEPWVARIAFPSVLAICSVAMIAMWAPQWRGPGYKLEWHLPELLKIRAENQTRQEALQLPSKQDCYLTRQTTRGQNPGRGHCYPGRLYGPWISYEDHQLEVPTPFRSRLQKYDQDVQFPLSCGLPQQCFYIPWLWIRPILLLSWGSPTPYLRQPLLWGFS